MTCSDFLIRYTDFRDGGLSVGSSRLCHDHLEACSACRRYDEVLRRGVDVLNEAPVVLPEEDFHARLQHSIYTLREQRRRRRLPRAGTGAMSLIAMAAVVATVLLTPLLREPDAVVDLPPILVQGPVVSNPSVLSGAIPIAYEVRGLGELTLWTRSNALLYRHSSLYNRYREPGLVLTGLR